MTAREALSRAIQTRHKGTSGATVRGLLDSSVLTVGRNLSNQSGEYMTLSFDTPDLTEWTIGQGLSTSAGGVEDRIDATFNVWSDSRSQVATEQIINAVSALYDHQILTLSSSWTMQHAKRELTQIIEEPEDGGWHGVVSYEYRIGRRG